MPLNGTPRVTVALPLYRSARFIDLIDDNLSNLLALDFPVEILISDRHLYDDALDRLQERYGDRPNIRLLRAEDRIGWVDHFNLLLSEANGVYFMWMPHDDSFPQDYLPKLIEPLEGDPTAVLAFGNVRAIGREGRPRRNALLPPPPLDSDEPWTTRTMLRLATHWNPGIAFRGLFRREPIVRSGLFMRSTRRDVNADRFWVSATGFLGRWRYVPDCYCVKRYYPTSTHARWKLTPTVWFRAFPVLSRYSWDFARPRSRALLAIATFGFWSLGRALRCAADKRSISARFLRSSGFAMEKAAAILAGPAPSFPKPTPAMVLPETPEGRVSSEQKRSLTGHPEKWRLES